MPVKSGLDPLVLALRAEKTRIEARLAQPRTEPTGENPYEEPSQLQKPDSLRLRLKEIDKALDARAMAAARASASPPPSSSTTPEVRAEWQRLLKAVSDSRSAEPAPPPGPRLKVTLARAALPRFRVKPDRASLMLVGVLSAIVAGLLAALVRGRLEARAFRAYGIRTGEHPVAVPQTTLRMGPNLLPKLLGPAPDPPPTPLPAAPVKAITREPIPLAPRIPTSIGHPALAPTAITPIPEVPTVPLTPIPPAAAAPAPTTPIPPPAQAPATPIPPAHAPAQVSGAPTPKRLLDQPPNTATYGERGRRGSGERAARRVTQIYGTPPAPDLKGASNALRTTQTYGSPPVAIPPYRPSSSGEDGAARDEVPAPANTTSLRPLPMIPVARTSSAPPPANAPGTRSNAPLIETSYSYVSTPLPPPMPGGSDAFALNPPSTQPYGRMRTSTAEPGVIVSAATEPARTATPLLPPPGPRETPAALGVTTHPVQVEWRPDASLSPEAHKKFYPEIVSLAVDACFVVAVSGTTGNASEQARIACEIALGLAVLGTPRVLLLEGNFHYPHVHKLMNLNVAITAGFSQQLQARIHAPGDRNWQVTRCSPTLHVLAEGVMRTPGLLLSRQFEESVRALRTGYDILVISAPAALSEPEGRALSDVVDGVVIMESKTKLDAAPEVTRFFARQRFVRVLGV
jgi:Mrp family chromosome partitioning ATPase